jgi:hypothetical protein
MTETEKSAAELVDEIKRAREWFNLLTSEEHDVVRAAIFQEEPQAVAKAMLANPLVATIVQRSAMAFIMLIVHEQAKEIGMS